MTKAFVSWSSGKDSAFALCEGRRTGLEIVGILTTVNELYGRVAMHGVRNSVLDCQIRALGLPAITVNIPVPCPNEVYETRMAEACAQIRAGGVRHIVFGDLFLEDIRRYREDRLAGTGMKPMFPLFGINTTTLAREMVAGGLRARLTCIDPRVLDRTFAGRDFDGALLDDLPTSVDPCGERGEFHSFAYAGPMFSHPIPIQSGEVVHRDGFVFADVLPAKSPNH